MMRCLCSGVRVSVMVALAFYPIGREGAINNDRLDRYAPRGDLRHV
jgi:hypothetical protein